MSEKTTLKVKSTEYLNPITSFFNLVKPLDIFSTNYDVNIERMCEKLGLECIDGFDPKWNPIIFNDKDCDIRLFKLHGSINWYRTEQGDYVRSVIQSTDMRIKLSSGEHAIPIILYPGRKLHYIEPVLEMLALLKAKIMKAKYCILIGYSFKDDHLSKLFKYASRTNKELILILITPEAYQIYYNSLKRHSDTEFRHGYAHEDIDSKGFDVDIESDLKGRVICLPYTIEKILPKLKNEYLDKVIEAEKYDKTLNAISPKDSIDEWKKCLKLYMECEYLEKVDRLLDRLDEQGLSWNEMFSTDWKYTFEVSIRGLINSVICGDLYHQRKWKSRLDKITHYFSLDNFLFIPELGAKTITIPPNIKLYFQVQKSNVSSEDVVQSMQDKIIPFIRSKLSVLQDGHSKQDTLAQLLTGLEGYTVYISSWQPSSMTFDRYFDMRKNVNQNQFVKLSDAYKKFYHSETENDQEAVANIIHQIESKTIAKDLIDILDILN